MVETGVVVLGVLLLTFRSEILTRLLGLSATVDELRFRQSIQTPEIAALGREISEIKRRLSLAGVPETADGVADTQATSPQASASSFSQALPIPQPRPAPAEDRAATSFEPTKLIPVFGNASAQQSTAKKQREFESLLGANWLAKLGIAAIAVAVAFFLQYAFRSGLIGPVGQVSIGLFGSAVMLCGGQVLLRKAQFRNYAQALSSGGIVVYFLSIYAAYAFYQPHLIGYGPAFAAFAIGALATSILAIANDTEVVAAICILGAFTAPALIRDGAGPPNPDGMVRLYSYLAVLNVWVIGLLRFRTWNSLAVISFGSTWCLFYGASPVNHSGWTTETFAVLFLLFACYTGVRALTSNKSVYGNGHISELSPSAQAGVALIVGGCVAFLIASALILDTTRLFGFPGLAFAGVLTAVVLSGLAATIPDLPDENDEKVRSILGYCSVFGLIAMLWSPDFSLPPLPSNQVPIAFAFTLFNFLLFQGMSLLLHRRLNQESPAMVLSVGNVLIHCMTAAHVLRTVAIFGTPAISLWMPLAECLFLGSLWLVSTDRESLAMRATLVITAQLLPLYGLLAMFEQPISSSSGAFLFAGEFVLVSLISIAVRPRIAALSFRADLLTVLANAALYFCLIARAIGSSGFSDTGIAPLAMWAIALAIYHAAIGATSKASRGTNDDLLHRLTYLGIAITFVSIAIPIQLKASYITLAWSVEAVVLIWAGKDAKERRATYYGLTILTLAATKALAIDLFSNPTPFHFLLNERMLAGLSVIGAAYASAWLISRDEQWNATNSAPSVIDPLLNWLLKNVVTTLLLSANVLTLIFGSFELWSYFESHGTHNEQFNLQQLALSLFWTVYALIGVSVGIWKRLRAVRLFAMGLLYISILKAFLFDLSNLESLYRIFSFFTLGVILLVVSYLYTHFEERLKD